jgi:anti-sigma factor RsiW
MDCKETQELLPAHVDRELGLPEAIEIDRHLHSCAACHGEFVEQSALRAAVKRQGTYFRAPGDLEARIMAALPVEGESPVAPTKHGWRWLGPWTWLNLGGALAAAVALFWSVGLYLALPSADDLIADEVVASHVRSLMANHIADVASSDQHTVKPWFSGKLDFSPTVTDLTGQGFPLIGGRLDYVDHRPVAALVYRHRQHLINVYVWPAGDRRDSAPRTLSHQGYHLVHWVGGGMVHWVISDVNLRELMELVGTLSGQERKAG